MLFLLMATIHAAESRISYVTLDSAAEQRPMTYGVYEPPGWDGQSPLPLVVFLHGGGDDQTAWERHPVVTRTLDTWIGDGRLPPFLAVIPDGSKGFWTNWHDGTHRYADWVMQEVIPDARSRYPIKEGRENQHLMGISMGGAGTLLIGLDHLDQFASLTVASAPVFDADQMEQFLSSGMARAWQLDRIVGPADRAQVEAHTAYRIDSPEELGGARLFMAAGKADLPGILNLNRQFHEHLVAAGVGHEWLEFAGGHQWSAWAKVFPVALCGHLGGRDCGG